MNSKTAVLFPGQGSQEKGMGRALAEQWTDAMDIWKTAERESGLPLREIYWEGDESAMADTRNLQPAMTAVTLSLWLYLKDRLRASALAGHSLGEFSALAAAGVVEMPEALRLVSLRGRLMAQAGGDDEGMAALLKLPAAAVEEIVSRAANLTGLEIRIANYNSPAQFVLSGKKQALESCVEFARESKGRLVPLAVSGAFHSPLMATAADEFAKVLRKVEFRAPAIPVYFNVTAQPQANPETIREIVASQMTSSVLWTQIMHGLWGEGVRRFVELGPKGVLTRLVKPNLADETEPFETLNIAAFEEAQAFQG